MPKEKKPQDTETKGNRFSVKLYGITHGYIAITALVLGISQLYIPSFHPYIWAVAGIFAPFSYFTVFYYIRKIKKLIVSDASGKNRDKIIRQMNWLPYKLTFFLYFFNFFIFITGILLHDTGILDIFEAMMLAMLIGAYLFFGFENALFELRKEGYYENIRKIRIPFRLKIFITFMVFIIIPLGFIAAKLYFATTSGMTILGASSYNAIIQTVWRTMIIALVSGFVLGHNIIFPIRIMSEDMKKVQSSGFQIQTPVFTVDEFGLLSTGFNEMVEGLKEKEVIKSTFGKVVDPVIRDTLLSREAAPGGKSEYGVVLFSDIRKFTSLAEKTEPDELIRILNTYFEKMTEAVAHQSGLINKFIGDAILAIFNTPVPIDNPEGKALQSAVQMIRELNKLNQENNWNLKAGVGIHSGDLIAGTVGSTERMEYTVIGDVVNTASRIESVTKIYGIPLIASGSVIARAVLNRNEETRVRIREIDRAILKGKEEPVTLYEIFGYEEENTLHKKLQYNEIFQTGLSLYRKGRFNEAKSKFSLYKESLPEDPLADIFLSRCGHLLSNPPGKNWKGIAKIRLK